MCGVIERKKYDFWKLKKIIYQNMILPLKMVKYTTEV